jgi:ABC-2 type transport system permease protein
MTQNLGGMALTTSIRYPYIPLITDVEKHHPIMRGVETVSLPFVARLEASTTTPKGIQFTPLLFSSKGSWLSAPNTYSVAPNSISAPKPGEPRGPFMLAGVLEGNFPSHFAGRPAPIKGTETLAQSPKTSIFVLGTSHVLDQTLPQFRGTDALITNALAFLTKDDTLIGVQAKGEILRPLKNIPNPVKDLVKVICIVGVPLLPIAWGLFRWRRRSAWRRTLASGFAQP